MHVLTADSMRALDRRAIEELGVPSMVLMENAALGVAEAIAAELPGVERALVVCGPGNNGGDGLALARQLATRGVAVHAVVVREGGLSTDAATQLEIVRRLGLDVEECKPEEAAGRLSGPLSGADLVVDAIFGTGLSRPLSGDWARLAEWLRGASVPMVAIDLPSGLFGSEARIPGPHLQADLTVTFVAPKIAHVLPPASESCGKLAVSDLGVPGLLDGVEPDLELLTGSELRALLPPRPRDAHKGSCGHLLVWAGSPGKSGAAVLAARAAGRIGAGLVTVACPEPILATVEAASVESMTEPLPAVDAAAMLDRLIELTEPRTALAAGPGLGQSEPVRQAVRGLIEQCLLPMVLDADALNALAGELRLLRGRRAPAVLTPHPGELGRLLGITAGEVQSDRLAAARRAAEEAGCTVVLKGHRTIVATTGTPPAVDGVGGPELASGGSGDVLTGIIGGLMASGLEPHDAARLGVHVHATAGREVCEALGVRSLLAGDLVERIPPVLRRLSCE